MKTDAYIKLPHTCVIPSSRSESASIIRRYRKAGASVVRRRVDTAYGLKSPGLGDVDRMCVYITYMGYGFAILLSHKAPEFMCGREKLDRVLAVA
jgi:hypothetical protein